MSRQGHPAGRDDVAQDARDASGALGANPSKLESLLVERIVACWLQVHYAEQILAQRLPENPGPATHKELLRRQESSQRRYHAAIKDLTLVRKLVKPPVSPFELASRPVAEGKPREAGHARGTDALPFRRTTATLVENG